MYKVEWTEYGKGTYAELLESVMAVSHDSANALNEKIEKLTDSLATSVIFALALKKYLVIAAVLFPKIFQCATKSGVA